MKIRTRFAPSSTGYLHLGGIRTALYSWLFARQNNGEFILRIEDTDLERSTPSAIKSIIDSMNWLNLKWDKGPYLQTKRFDRYNIVINYMLESGTAYRCYCSKKQLDSLRKEQIIKGEKPRYNGRCRYDYGENKTNKPFVVRFANPQGGSVIFNDQIRGPIKFSNQELDDLIIRRTDGSPTYNFCAVVDDWDMKITHVIRGEEHINNTPRQINILRSLNASIPVYAHVSMINGNDGKKLSKRYGAADVMHYRNEGFLPEALLNYLIRLGWSNGNQEIFSRKDMIELFSLEKVSKSASTFNTDKLLWLNQYYIKTMPPKYVVNYLQWQIEQANLDISSGPELVDLLNLFGKRCKTLKEIVKNCRYLYEDFNEFDFDASKKYLNIVASQPLEIVRDKIAAIKEWTIDNIYHAIQATANELEVKISEVSMPLRVAVTGTDRSPELNMILRAIGKNRILTRINKALIFIAEHERTSNVLE